MLKFLHLWLILSSIVFMSYVSASDLKNIWKEKRSDQYQAYDELRLKQLESVFEKLFTEPLSHELKQQLADLKLSAYESGDFLVVSESRAPYSGHGVYIIRKKSASSILLQAPHSLYDLGTGSIAIKLMYENNIKALAINTTHRRNGDMAHKSNTAFSLFSRVFAQNHQQARVIQLHGFNPDGRQQTRQVDVILSNGTILNYHPLLEQSRCIKKTTGLHSRVYPAEISVLGGTRNRIRKILSRLEGSRFEHIELSFRTRQLLQRSKKTRRLFSRCIF